MMKTIFKLFVTLLLFASVITRANDTSQAPGEEVGRFIIDARDTLVQKLNSFSSEKGIGIYYEALTNASTFMGAAKKESSQWSVGNSIIHKTAQLLLNPAHAMDEQLLNFVPVDHQKFGLFGFLPVSQLIKCISSASQNPKILALKTVYETFLSGDQNSFNTALKKNIPFAGAFDKKSKICQYLCRVNIFIITEIIFGTGLLAIFILTWHLGKVLYRISSVVLILALFPHTLRAILHMIIKGNPPIVLLYNPVIIVAWLGVLLGLIIELVQKDGIRIAIASMIGVAFICFAGRFGDADTIRILTGVLNKYSWVAAHIMSPALGYAGLCIAVLSVFAFLMGIRMPSQSPLSRSVRLWSKDGLSFGRVLTLMCIVLSGLWTAQPWTRF